MKTMTVVLLTLVLAWTAVWCGEPDEGGKKKGPPPGAEQQKIREALARKVSFEFVDTPFGEVINFLQTLANVPFIVDPKAGNRKDAKITLKVADMSLEQGLSWVAKLVELKWDARDGAVFIFDPRQEKRAVGEMDPFDDGPPKQPKRQEPKLTMKLPDGTVIEADAPLMMMPGLAQLILSRAVDEAKDGLLAFRIGRDIPPDVDPEKLKALLAQVAPNVKASYEQALTVLVLTSEDPAALRRAAALMRAFRMEPQRPPFGGPPGDEGFMVKRKPPFGPEGKGPGEKQPKPPPEAPGQF